MGEKVLLMVANVDWIFLAHRLPIAKHALKNGFRVVVLTNDSGQSNRILDEGLEFIHIPISRSGVNPIIEFFLFVRLFFLYKKINPSVVYQVTLKPVIYGTLISRILRIPTVNAISGLGYNFTIGRKGFVQRRMIELMRIGFSKKNNHLIFENNDDKEELFELDIISKNNHVSLVKGVGVDLNSNPYSAPASKEKLVVLLATRMLWDKGIKEFVEAAKLLMERFNGKVVFKLCGRIDTGNPESVSEEYLKSIEIEGFLKWDGHSDQIFEEYKLSDIVVLPSYREGMPTVLIEASAIGRPLITTNAIGCRECVEEGWNGYKVPINSIDKLAQAIEKLLVNKKLRVNMGLHSREKAEKEFDQREVVRKHIDICEQSIK